MNTILCGDVLEKLKEMSDESVHCIVTSPPYFGLRDYGVKGQIGLEKTPEEYVSKLVEVFHEVRRVLRNDGTLWLNLGDSYAMSSIRGGTKPFSGNVGAHAGYVEGSVRFGKRSIPNGLKAKDLIGIPWRVAFALQADGWYLRQDIIWAKPNPMPESVTDRCTKSHEYIFMLSKSPKYYYDAKTIKEPGVTHERRAHGVTRDRVLGYNSKQANIDKQRGHSRKHTGFNERWDAMTK